MPMNTRNILLLLFFFLCANINLSAQDKVVCKKKRGGDIFEHSIQKTDSTTVISIVIDSNSLSFVEIPNNFYDESDSVIIEIRKCTYWDENINYDISFCYIAGIYHFALWLDPKLFSIKEEGYNYYFYDVDLYYKDRELYDRLNNNKE